MLGQETSSGLVRILRIPLLTDFFNLTFTSSYDREYCSRYTKVGEKNG
jgi:hypothetical protein